MAMIVVDRNFVAVTFAGAINDLRQSLVFIRLKDAFQISDIGKARRRLPVVTASALEMAGAKGY